MTAVAPVDAPVDDRDRPPVDDRSPTVWLRRNLFGSWSSAVMTVIIGLAVAWAVSRAVRFVFVTADWEIVRRNLVLFMIGSFDRDQLWRPWTALAVLAGTVGLVTGMLSATAAEIARQTDRPVAVGGPVATLRRFWPALLLVVGLLSLTRTWSPTLLTLGIGVLGALAFQGGRRSPASIRRLWWVVVLVGLVAAVQVLAARGGVGWDQWGGLHLNLFVTFAGIVLAFPLGLLLALGRRSRLPAIRAVSIAYIELFRGVPLVTLLLMAQLMLGFFLPSYVDPPSVVIRALVVIVIFESAYIAEIVRGGLQSVPHGQVEAAQAVGLSPVAIMRRITLPQALRSVIPAMVGQFISLFQDTTLLSVITLTEVLAVSQIVTNQDAFVGLGLQSVTLPFVAFIFWAVSYSMSRESRRLETRLGIGTR